jgi:acyl-CoA reductase-like NAD-dependent aldehyde dehydrogenase
MVSKMQRDLCAAQVQAALRDGATLLHRSSTPLDASPSRQHGNTQEEGSWHPVVVLNDLREEMVIQRAETFGPVVAISSFDGMTILYDRKGSVLLECR